MSEQFWVGVNPPQKYSLLILNIESLSSEQEMIQDLLTFIHCFSSRLHVLLNYRNALK